MPGVATSASAGAATSAATCDALGVTPYDESTGKGELRYVQTVMCSDEAVDPGMDEDARAAISLRLQREHARAAAKRYVWTSRDGEVISCEG